MKVSDLIKQLTDELNPDEEVFALVYHKGMFPDLDGSLVTDEAWNKVTDDFYRHYDDTDIYTAISSACIEESDTEEVA